MDRSGDQENAERQRLVPGMLSDASRDANITSAGGVAMMRSKRFVPKPGTRKVFADGGGDRLSGKR